MKIPATLKRGDKVGVTATSRKVFAPQIQHGVETFREWGLNVEESKMLFSDSHSYLAGTDVERIAGLQEFLDDEQCRAIFCARGGYGSSRIIDRLQLAQLEKNPKWIIGFSDVTALHLKLFKAGIASIHGTMPILFDKPDAQESIQSLKKLLFKGESVIQALKGNPSNRPGKVQGPLIGGNLSLIVDSLGTSSEIDSRGAILVIEEIDEYLYRIDRMINHLKRAGKLDNLKGLVIGYISDTKDTEVFNESIEAIVHNAVKEFEFPVAFNFPIGHENPNLCFLHGGRHELSVEVNQASLTLLR